MDSMRHFTAFIADDEAVTAIEYGLLAALIAVVAAIGISATGTSLSALYIIWTGAVIAAL
jgi:pilus assembly protein Flp/PilA